MAFLQPKRVIRVVLALAGGTLFGFHGWLLATQVADILRGKNTPIFTPHLDAGGFVVVIEPGSPPATNRGVVMRTSAVSGR